VQKVQTCRTYCQFSIPDRTCYAKLLSSHWCAEITGIILANSAVWKMTAWVWPRLKCHHIVHYVWVQENTCTYLEWTRTSLEHFLRCNHPRQHAKSSDSLGRVITSIQGSTGARKMFLVQNRFWVVEEPVAISKLEQYKATLMVPDKHGKMYQSHASTHWMQDKH